MTTVPAAADMGLSLALGGMGELGLAATQLGINLVGILVAATATLAVQRLFWRRAPRTTPALPTGHPPGTMDG